MKQINLHHFRKVARNVIDPKNSKSLSKFILQLQYTRKQTYTTSKRETADNVTDPRNSKSLSNRISSPKFLLQLQFHNVLNRHQLPIEENVIPCLFTRSIPIIRVARETRILAARTGRCRH